ncbi:hypothetical protein V8E53_001640 [Lactarius tabidus]
MATEEDKKMAENWKDDADGILIFTGLFSAAVASLISVSIQNIQQNPQDISNFYLANTYQATINPNSSSSLPTSPPPFTPPKYAVWVNALWFLSLVISLTCALLATLLQQWARRYLKITQPRYSPHRRARIRAFFAEGIDKFLLPWAVEALPTMLHLSLFLFFAGLAVFLWNVNLTIFKLVLSWVGLCTALYGCITFIPVFRHDSPYQTPLSLPVWHFVTRIPFLTFRALQWITPKLWRYFHCFNYETYSRFRDLAECYRKLLVQGMQKTAEETAFNSPSEIDTRAFLWTFDSLDEDHELERFFAGLPGFRGSKMVKDPLPDLTPEQQEKLLDALVGLSDRTSSSDLLPEFVKIRRTVICRKAIGPADIPDAILQVLDRIVSHHQYGPVQSAEIARLVRGWDNGEVHETMMVRAVVSSVVARAQRRDDLWFSMAADEMGVPESVLRTHATHGNNLSLAVLIHVVRKQFTFFQKRYWPYSTFSNVLFAASAFYVLDTSPELQHKFCALWNEVVRGANGTIPWYILKPIRNTYLTLHQHTDSAPTAFDTSTGDYDGILANPTVYPLCNVPGHHSHSTTHIHDVSVSTTIPRAVLHDNDAPVPPSPADVPPPSVLSSPIHVDETPMDAPLLDNNMSVPVSFHPTCQTATESVHDSTTSPDPAAAAATRDDTSARTLALTTCETSMSASSASPPATVSPQNHTDLLVHSDAPEIPSSASPVLDAITGTSPRPTFAPLLDTAKGSRMAGSHDDKDTPDIPSANRTIQTNTVAILDRPQPPPRTTLPSATDITVASPLGQKTDAERTGDQPHYASDCLYEIE